MNRNGNAIVETVLWIGVATAALGMTLELSRRCMWQMRLIGIVRVAGALSGTGRVGLADIEQEVRSYHRQLQPNTTGLSFSMDRFLGVPSASFYRLLSNRVQLHLPSGTTLEETLVVQQEESS